MATQGYGNQETAPPRAAPSRTGQGHDGEITGRKDPPPRDDAHREIVTPGDGAGPAPSVDREVDPGVGP